jgi:hypothetical protein
MFWDTLSAAAGHVLVLSWFSLRTLLNINTYSPEQVELCL